MELAGFDFYSMLGEKSKEYLSEVLKPIEAPKGTILFFQGDICEDILLLSDGELRLFIQGDEADIITLYHLKEGEQCIVNTSSAISSSPAIATAETMSDISGWLLPRSSAKTLMRDNDLYQDFIFSLFTIKLSSLAEIIEDMMDFATHTDWRVPTIEEIQTFTVEMQNVGLIPFYQNPACHRVVGYNDDNTTIQNTNTHNIPPIGTITDWTEQNAGVRCVRDLPVGM